jgi:hypothetical protein
MTVFGFRNKVESDSDTKADQLLTRERQSLCGAAMQRSWTEGSRLILISTRLSKYGSSQNH